MKARRFWLGLIVCATAAAIPETRAHADAAPYDIVAVYKRSEGDKNLEAELENGSIIPDGTDGARLLEFRMKLNRGSLGAVNKILFDGFSIWFGATSSQGRSQRFARKDVSVAEIAPAANVGLYKWTDPSGGSQREVPLTVHVRAKFSPQFLCAIETSIRESIGKPWHTLKQPAGDDKKKATNKKGAKPQDSAEIEKEQIAASEAFWSPFFFGKRLPQSVIVKPDDPHRTPILYSFCKPNYFDFEAAYAMDDKEGQKSRSHLAFGYAVGSAKDLERIHKRQMFRLMKSADLGKFETSEGHLDFQPDDFDETNDRHSECLKEHCDIYIQQQFKFTVLRTGRLFAVRERAVDRVRDEMASVMDQGSQLIVAIATSPQGVCPNLRDSAFTYQLQVEGTADPKVLKLEFRDNCTAVIREDFKQHLGKKVTFRVKYRINDSADLVVYNQTVEVANLGIIYTLPIITEIESWLKGRQGNDIQATSSLPLAYALRFTGPNRDSLFAITFPGKISYNSRHSPHFAEYLSIFLHVSLLAGSFTPDPNKDIRAQVTGPFVVTIGAGISLAQFLHVAWAVDPGHNEHFLLVGLGIQDFAKLFLR